MEQEMTAMFSGIFTAVKKKGDSVTAGTLIGQIFEARGRAVNATDTGIINFIAIHGSHVNVNETICIIEDGIAGPPPALRSS